MKIIAGIDTEFDGEARPATGAFCFPGAAVLLVHVNSARRRAYWVFGAGATAG
jgi:hypothetical protein